MRKRGRGLLFAAALMMVLQISLWPIAARAEESGTEETGAAATYTVSFDLNGHGTGAPEGQSVTEGGTAVEPASPTDENYDFVYWSQDPGGSAVFDFATPISSDLVLYAIWSEKAPESFTLTLSNATCNVFSGTEGEVTEGTSVRVTATVPEGMYFYQWEASGVTLSDSSAETVSFTMPSGAVSLSAVMNSPVTVSFDLNGHGQSAPAAQSIKPGTCAAEPASPTDAQYEFKGWTVSKTDLTPFDFSTPITENTTLYAIWTIKGFTLTLTDAQARDTADKEIASGSSVPGGTMVTVKAVPAEGFVFDHWEATGITLTEEESKGESLIFTMPFADVTLKAVTKEKIYKVTFDLGGHGGAPDQEVKEGGLVGRPSEPEADGFMFMGWFSDPEFYTGYDFATPVTKDLVIYAKWIEQIGRATVLVQLPVDGSLGAEPKVTAQQYTVDHYVWHNKIDSDSPMKTGEAFEEGRQYKLQVWLKVTDKDYYFDETTVAVFNGGLPATLVKYEDSLLLAELIFTVPEEGTHTVTFDMNGHGNQVSEQAVKDGEKVSVPTNPVDSGYLFDGWYADPQLKKAYDFEKPVESDLILYAKWRSLVTYAEIIVAEPKLGEMPGGPALASSICSIASYEWIDAETGAVLAEDAVFEPGQSYVLRMKVRMDSDSFYFDDSTKIIVNGENASRIDAEALELIVEQTFTMEGEKRSSKGDLFDPQVNRIIIIVSAIGSLIVTGLLIFVILKRFFSEKKKKAAAEEKAQEDSLNDDDYYDANE